MIRPLGNKFFYGKDFLEVIQGLCSDCYFRYHKDNCSSFSTEEIIGKCDSRIFKKVKK